MTFSGGAGQDIVQSVEVALKACVFVTRRDVMCIIDAQGKERTGFNLISGRLASDTDDSQY